MIDIFNYNVYLISNYLSKKCKRILPLNYFQQYLSHAFVACNP